MKNTSSFCCVLCLVCLSGMAKAVDYYWADTAGGDYGDNTNWSPAVVPGSTDSAWFSTDKRLHRHPRRQLCPSRG